MSGRRKSQHSRREDAMTMTSAQDALYVIEVVIHDETAQSLKHLFLPPEGSLVSAAELKAACARLADATRAMKAAARQRAPRGSPDDV